MTGRKWIFMIMAVLTMGCIDRIDVDTATEPERLVVEGFYTDKPSECRIKLSKTVQFSNERNTPVYGAIVSVISSDGEEHIFYETSFGSYISCSDFQALPGMSYKLRIKYEGKVLESFEQELPDETSLVLRYETGKKTVISKATEQLITQPGVYVKASLPETETNRYYRWRLLPTFVFETEWAPPGFRRCWITEPYDFKDVYVHRETEGGYNKEITFIPASVDMLFDYSLLVKQYNMTEEGFNYWNSVKTQMENIGSIFDTPPFAIIGNMYNVEDSKDIVLGYFGVYRIQESRIKWNLGDFPYEFPFIKSGCEVLYPGVPQPECNDCRNYQSNIVTHIQPDWWED